MRYSFEALALFLFLLAHVPTFALSQEDLSPQFDLSDETSSHNGDAYMPGFTPIDRSIIGRADGDIREDLKNNVPAVANTISPGNKQFYRFPSSALHGPKSTSNPVIPDIKRRESESDHYELKKRADDVRYYLTISTCKQPTSSTTDDPPPQLLLFVSYTNPNADGTQNNAHVPPVTDGFGSFSDPTSGDVFIGVQALSAPQYTGSYTFELVISVDGFYTNYVDNSTLYFIDSDNGAAMFVSGDITQDNTAMTEWKSIGPQFSVYIANQGARQFNGLMRSYCALRNTTQSGRSSEDQTKVETGLIDARGENTALQQQFYVSGLQSGTNYFAAMGLPTKYSKAGSGQPGGGGILYKQVAFTTKTEDNCRIVYNQSFCGQVNYAVPANRSVNIQDLAKWYSNQSEFNYQFFDNALQQVACNTSSDSQYSLAVSCTDCAKAYKNWLCAVMNPRCHDYSSQKPYLQPRAISFPFLNGTLGSSTSDPQFNATNQKKMAYNSSRNPMIDNEVKPGPYKELLPCGSLCYDLVRTCPAVMGFACPYDPQGYNRSYGYPLMDGQNPQCNNPRAVFGVSAGSRTLPSTMAMLTIGIAVIVAI